VLAARRLTGLDAPAVATTVEVQARVQVAADIYRALPADERATISTEMAARLGPLWFGNRTEPDADAAAQHVHATTLTTTLAERGRLTIAAGPSRPEAVISEPVEAALARRGLTGRGAVRHDRAGSRHQSPAHLREQLHPPVLPDRDGPQHRL
jgi:hypothetical protein